MKLSDEQAIFNQQINALEILVNSTGRYRFRDADCYRPKTADYGHPESLHKSRLARDKVLDKRINGRWVYQRNTSAYEWIGIIWKMIDDKNRWGGDFSKPDGNHFSRTYGGRA
jgi:hypothetical protein